MSAQNVLCTVYGSRHEADLYLYVERREGLARVPEALLARFGPPREVLTFALHPTRTLARAKAVDVLAAIRERGYYLQLPPDKFPTQLCDGD
ncbi:MAG: YcgL domain-containing protein [Pseudomonadales bacterium]|jgi:uncharacterized protein YcgL (UPF0745 family)|nr:YcgL domain-containing protein [Pseudomonadales bacterium]